MLRTTFHNTITSPIPADLTTTSVISVLHDTPTLLTLSPLTTRNVHRGASTRDGFSVEVYDVWEVVDALPIPGLWKREINFTASFNLDRDEATAKVMMAWIDAPLGLVSRSEYRIKRADATDANTGGEGWVLEETVESSVNVLLRWLVESQLVPTREATHRMVFEKAKERVSGGADQSA